MSVSNANRRLDPIDDSRWESARADVEPGPVGIEPGMRIHYIACPPPSSYLKPKGTILLIHGWPQTNYQFRRVITPLSDAGYLVVAPDYRGAGASTKPRDGYTKDIMARDLHTLLTQVLGIKEPAHVVGCDIGAMVAHAYAVQFPEDTASLCWSESVLPGSAAFKERSSGILAWHYSFHSVPDLPELLVAGKERIYLKHFYDRLSQNPNAISEDDLGVYAQAFAQPGALRSGFDIYRAFGEDAAMFDKWTKDKGRCPVRCLSLWGASSFADEAKATAMAGAYYQSVEFASIAGAGHWVAEENPKQFVEALLAWVAKE